MKLHFGTPIQDLAFRFDISYSVVSKTFRNILHDKISELLARKKRITIVHVIVVQTTLWA